MWAATSAARSWPLIRDIREGDFAVAELSSFQLISMRESPDIAVVTNITPNHLDVHKDMQEYIDAKRNIFAAPGGVFPHRVGVDNDVAASFANPECVRGQLFEFSVKRPVRTRRVSRGGRHSLHVGERRAHQDHARQ